MSTDTKDLDALAERIRGAHLRAVTGRKEWVEATLELAAALAEARAKFPSDQKFSAWLREKKISDLDANARVALIKIGQNVEKARPALEATARRSRRMFWEQELKPSLDSQSVKPANPEASVQKLDGYIAKESDPQRTAYDRAYAALKPDERAVVAAFEKVCKAGGVDNLVKFFRDHLHYSLTPREFAQAAE
jgi:hypothetical protein